VIKEVGDAIITGTVRNFDQPGLINIFVNGQENPNGDLSLDGVWGASLRHFGENMTIRLEFEHQTDGLAYYEFDLNTIDLGESYKESLDFSDFTPMVP